MTQKESIFAELKSLELSSGSDFWTLNRAIACTLSDSELLEWYGSQKSKNIVLKSVLEKRDLKRLAAGQHKTIEKILDEFAKREKVIQACVWRWFGGSILRRKPTDEG